MTSTAKAANFDPVKGSTVNKGIDDAKVPDVTKFLKDMSYIAMMTPTLDQDPHDQDCIWGAPVIFWGLPATTKTSQIRQAAYEGNLVCCSIYPGTKQPEDFSGVIIPTPNGVVLECFLAAVRKLNAIGRGVILLSEVNNASKAVESALLGFVQDRLAGEQQLAPGIRIISDANPPKWSVNGYQMAPPTANRYCHFQVKCPSHRQVTGKWAAGKTQVRFDARGTEDLIRAHWNRVYQKYVSLASGYLERQPHSLHREPPTDHPQSGFNWASPKSWELGLRMAATSEILGYSDEHTWLCIEGCIGEEVSNDFSTWVRNADLPSPEDVLKHGWKPDMQRLDVAYAVLAGVSQYVSNLTDRQEALNAAVGAWKLYQSFIDIQMGDMIVNAAQSLINKDLSRNAGDAVKAVSDPVVGWLSRMKLVQYADK